MSKMRLSASRAMRWELFDPENQQPHISGKTVVVGHTEQKDAEMLDLGFLEVREVGIECDLRAFHELVVRR